jgi:glycosidase
VGRNGNVKEGFGIDAAKDFPLFQVLKTVPKALPSGNVSRLPALFERRKELEDQLLTSHGEASRFFVTFLDNHDQAERFRHPRTPDAQVTLALGLLFTLQGIPCLYYGTEQDLVGTVNHQGEHVAQPFEGVREALWGKPDAFSMDKATYRYIQKLSELRGMLPALRYGRQYFRPVSGNGRDFGLSSDVGGVVALARILGDMEVLVVANTSPASPFEGHVLVDPVLNSQNPSMEMLLSNLGRPSYQSAIENSMAVTWESGSRGAPYQTTSVRVSLDPMEFQLFTQVV